MQHLENDRVPGARQRPFPVGIAPMLLQRANAPFIQDGWIFEPKLDGMRCIVYVDEGKATLFSKPGRDITDIFPKLSAQLCNQPTGVYDGEIVAHHDDGSISFELLQERWALRSHKEIDRADLINPVSFTLSMFCIW